MTIKDVEKLTGLTAKAIRYYEEQGLIKQKTVLFGFEQRLPKRWNTNRRIWGINTIWRKWRN